MKKESLFEAVMILVDSMVFMVVLTIFYLINCDKLGREQTLDIVRIPETMATITALISGIVLYFKAMKKAKQAKYEHRHKK